MFSLSPAGTMKWLHGSHSVTEWLDGGVVAPLSLSQNVYTARLVWMEVALR